jgi:uncharacterized protein (TIGR00369 family)
MALHDEAQKLFDVPLLQFLGARFEGWSEGVARVTLSVNQNSLNANDRVHGGTLYTLLDIAAYLALLPSLEQGQTAVTHNINASLFGALSGGAELVFDARIVHRGRTLAFIRAAAHAGDRPIAEATVCKSIIVLR